MQSSGDNGSKAALSGLKYTSLLSTEVHLVAVALVPVSAH